MENIKISVIIPAYKTKEELLRRAIDNIIGQTFNEWELLIINDGADENVRNIIFSYKNKVNVVKESIRKKTAESTCRCLHYFETKKAHGGPAHSRNIALKYAQGDYLFFHDHDDYLYSEGYTKNALENMYNEILKEDADILFFGVKRKNIIRKTHYDIKPINKNLALSSPENLKNIFLYFEIGIFPLWGQLIKRKLLIDNKINNNKIELKIKNDG